MSSIVRFGSVLNIDSVLHALAGLSLTSDEPYGVEIRPLLVATIKRLPQRTIESTLPTPGTVCPAVTFQTPLGPSITAAPSSRSIFTAAAAIGFIHFQVRPYRRPPVSLCTGS